MPLMTDAPPKGIEKVLDAAVAELVGHGAISIGGRDRPAVSAPIRVYNIGADAIAAGSGLSGAQPVGWLSTLTTNGEVRGTIELVPQKATSKKAAPDALRFGGFTTGPLQRSLAAAVEAAEKTAGRNPVKIAVIRAPALYLLALWLNDQHGDRLVPIAPAPVHLSAGESYPADRALAALKEAAASVARTDDARS